MHPRASFRRQRLPGIDEGVTVHKTYRPHGGVPVLRFVHPRLTAMWRALREADAEVYYCRAAGMLAGVVAEFCRRHGRRSIYAGASDMAPSIPGPSSSFAVASKGTACKSRRGSFHQQAG